MHLREANSATALLQFYQQEKNRKILYEIPWLKFLNFIIQTELLPQSNFLTLFECSLATREVVE